VSEKEIVVAFYGWRFIKEDWRYDVDREAILTLSQELSEQYGAFGIRLDWRWESEPVLDVGGYGDLLNIVRLQSLSDGVSNLCLGHVIGASRGCDLMEDIKRGISRLAFAPETIEPEGSNKVVCHNCGCGC